MRFVKWYGKYRDTVFLSAGSYVDEIYENDFKDLFIYSILYCIISLIKKPRTWRTEKRVPKY